MRGTDRISTKDLLKELINRDGDQPWAALWEADVLKDNTRGPAAKLARLLKPFEVIPETIREIDGSTPKGYKRNTFEDAFSRYLPPESPHKVATTPQPASIKAPRAILMTQQPPSVASSEMAGNPHQ